MSNTDKNAKEDWQRKDVVEKLLTVWKQNPHLRLGQLLINSLDNMQESSKLFYMEDYDLIDKLYEKLSTNSITYVRSKSSRPPR